jgi:hypothetical protein
MEMHKAHHEKLEGVLAKEHPLVKSSQSMMDHCEKCMKAAKDGMEGEEPEEKAAAAGGISKELEARLSGIEKTFSEGMELIKKMPANQAIAHSGVPELGKGKSAQFETLLSN